MKYTQGKWKAKDSIGKRFACVGTEDVNVALLVYKRDAKLIASAPDLLDALNGIIEIGKRDLSNPKYDDYFKIAKQAIAKAEEEL